MTAEGDATTVEATFVFADIAGFTALTEAHGDHDAAALVAEFCQSVRAELPASGGSEVKTIGDAVMLAVPDPGAAIVLALRIAHELMRGHGAPAVRVGLHHGPAIEREGDYFGAAVNLAARVSGEAGGGEVLLTGHTAALAPDLEGVLYEPRGPHARDWASKRGRTHTPPALPSTLTKQPRSHYAPPTGAAPHLHRHKGAVAAPHRRGPQRRFGGA